MATLASRNVFAVFVLLQIGANYSIAGEKNTERVTWSEVSSAVAGATIELALPTGTTIRGKLLEVEPEGLTLNVGKTSNSKDVAKGQASIPRASVSTIKARKCGVKWRMILGVGVPAGLLGAAGASINAQSPTVKGPDAAGVILGIGAGSAIAGYFAGRHFDCRVTYLSVIPQPASRE